MKQAKITNQSSKIINQMIIRPLTLIETPCQNWQGITGVSFAFRKESRRFDQKHLESCKLNPKISTKCPSQVKQKG
jgi:hypothetical protein